MSRRSQHKLDDGASVAEHAARLRARPGWDPAAGLADPSAERQRQLGALHAAAVLQQADDCEECATVRASSADASALCPVHLARALGL